MICLRRLQFFLISSLRTMTEGQKGLLTVHHRNRLTENAEEQDQHSLLPAALFIERILI